MKILHTADWHIGKKLHKHDLSPDFELFTNWLCELIEEEQVELLLVSGDIFDLANPSSEARSSYYRALLKLSQLNCQLILTGGNHDSPAMLNAPRELLRHLNIHIVGSLGAEASDCIIPIKDAKGSTEFLIAALPYLREPDLRMADSEISYENRVEALRAGIARVYREVAASCEEQYPQLPTLAMGHLYAAGASSSDSERDIQIGNEASFDANQFGEYFRYVALGHIHRPQQVKASIPVLYSGSPIALSFSERSDQKRVLLIDSADFSYQSISVPTFRHLKRISGNLSELKQKLTEVPAGDQLESLIELELQEERFNPASLAALDQLVRDHQQPGVKIVKHRAHFEQKSEGASELYDSSQALEDLKPREVFEQRLELEDYDEELKALLKEAFNEILEETLSREDR